MTRTQGLSESRDRGADAVAPGEESDAIVEALIDEARRRRTTTLNLGDRLSSGSDAERLLTALAASARRYDLELEARLATATPSRIVRRLRPAGVRTVRLTTPGVVRCGAAGVTVYAPELATLRELTEQLVDVKWEMLADEPRALDDPDALSHLWHLVPPTAARTADGCEVVNSPALAAWRRGSSASLLTQTRGPGFVRVLDRRTSAGQQGGKRERLIVLEGLAARVFLACDGRSGPAEIASGLEGRAAPGAVERALAALERSKLVASDAQGRFVALPNWWRAVEVD